MRRARRSPARSPGSTAMVFAWAFVRAEQPFHATDPELHPLKQLNDLWNRDKHRTLNSTMTYLDASEILGALSWQPANVQPIEARVPLKPGRPIKNRDLIAVLRFPPGSMPHVTASGPINFEIAFGEPDGKPRPHMRDTIAHVRDLVNRADALLDSD